VNKLKGQIVDIEVSGSMSLVTVSLTDETSIQSIIIDTPKTAAYLQKGNEINVLFKETEVVIGKGQSHQVSMLNRIAGQIKAIEKGSLICKLIIDTAVGEITSVISTKAVQDLQLDIDVPVVAMVELNEIMLSV